MKIVFSYIILPLLSVSCFAQKNAKALQVGDQMPNSELLFVSPNPKKTINLKELKGKVVILDFWSTSCSECIFMMPHFQELQDHFKNQLEILIIDDLKSDDEKKINHVISNIKKNRGVVMKLPYAFFNQDLLNYFPHISEPHEVVISPKGEIIAITFDTDLTQDNIQAVLNGKKIDFPLKDDFWNNTVPIVSHTNINNSKGIFVCSSLMGYIPFIHNPGGPKENEKGEVIGNLKPNLPLISLYMDAYSELFKNSPTIKYETKDSLFMGDPWSDKSKLFSYDIIFQGGKYTDDKYKECLRQDLDRVFNFSLRKGIEKDTFLILRTNDNIAKIYTHYQNWESNISTYNDAIKNHVNIYGHKMSIGFLSELLNKLTFNNRDLGIRDESNDSHEIDLDFPQDFDFTNKELVLSFLHEKGIEYTVEDREVDCVIVSDKKPGEPTVLNQ